MATLVMSSPAHPASRSAASPLRSIKPRLLWRGTLLLQDGTALPGVCFLSHLAPPFLGATSPGSLAQGKSSREDEGAEAEMCLALEMVRHRPLAIREAAEVGEAGTATSLPAAKAKEKEKGRLIEWKASGDIRVFINPEERITVAYFERHFCMGEDLVAADPPRSRQVLQLALDTQPWQLRAVSQSQDPFSTEYASTSYEASGSSSNLEVALFAQPAQEANGQRQMRLVLGRKVVRKAAGVRAQGRTSSGSASQRPDDPAPRSSSIAALMAVKRASPLFTLPAPPAESRRSSSSSSSNVQGLSQVQQVRRASTLRKSASTPNILELTPVKEEQAHSGAEDEERSASPLAAPSSHKASSSRASSARGNHTPGRRGEKRPRPSSTTSQPILSSASRSRLTSEDPLARTSPAVEVQIKREWSDGASTPLSATFPLPGASSAIAAGRAGSISSASGGGAKGSTMEQRNRASIKKLVHHQLLGRGLEKQDEDYIACFSLACAGTATALRHSIAQQPIDRAHAAQLVSTHLAMYLPAAPAVPSAPMPPTQPSTDGDATMSSVG